MLGVLETKARNASWWPQIAIAEDRAPSPCDGCGAGRLFDRRRQMALSVAASLLIHLAIALLFLVAVVLDFDDTKIGSEELDIELVAPRLAPPPASRALLGVREEQGGPKAQRAEKLPKTSSPKERSRSLSLRRSRSDQRRPLVRLQRSEVNSATRAQRTRVRKRRASLKAASHLAVALPNAIDPTRLLSAVKSEIVARRRRRQRFRATLRARERRLQQRWASFTSTTAPADSAAGASASGRTGSGARGKGNQQRSRSPRYGLKFYLSGRQQLTSKVVHPPQLVAFSKLSCRIASPEVTPATVRALVTLEGTIDVAYLRHSSSVRRFDRCALRQIRGMRFKPGTDKNGAPLDVWIHVRVSPGLPTTAL